MIEAADFVDAGRQRGLDWYAGVPCSFLTPFINHVIGDEGLTYVSSANEGDAVAAAAGAVIGGRRAVAMMQNSGLGNAVSPLTSLAYVFRIPMLLVCTHRGAPEVHDEPQHELMGRITGSMFDTIETPWEPFPGTVDAIDPALDRMERHFETARRPYALVMPKGAVRKVSLPGRTLARQRPRTTVEGDAFSRRGTDRLPRQAALEAIVASTPVDQSVIIASTGFTGRELYAIDDRPNQLYMVGSMGCASSLGLGLAMARPDLRVVVVDGDGAALMRLGNFATAGTYASGNYTHVLLDNEAHDSTGAQATVAPNVDFASVAAACGYARAVRTEDVDTLRAVLDAPPPSGGTFVHVKIRTGTMDDLPRPSITPVEVLDRLRAHIG